MRTKKGDSMWWGWTRSTGQGLFPEYDTLLVPLQSQGMNNVIFLVPGGFAHRPDLTMPEAQFLSFIQLIHALGADQAVYGLRRLGLGEVLQSYRSLEDLAARYVNAVQAFQPHGPYLFVGDCVGGIFAYEIARQLSLGPSKASLVLLDTEFPNISYKHGLTSELHTQEETRAHNALTSKVRKNWNQLVAMDRGFVEKLKYICHKFVSFARYRMSGEHQARETSARDELLLAGLIMNYEPHPFEGNLSLVITDELYEAGFEDAWERVAVNGLDIHRIPGDHGSYFYESARIVSKIIREFAKVNETSSRADRNGSK
jgi:thioesterase domain-containing protein